MDIKQEEERLKKQFKKNRSSVRNRLASTPSTPPCYNIGDIGPGGGIVFALPNTGINNTNFVYEINADPIQLATTQLALLPNKCRNQKPLTIKTRDVAQSVPNNAIVVDYGPGSNNPSFFPSDVSVGDILDAFDINGNSLFLPNAVPTVTLTTLLPNNFVFIAFNTSMSGAPNSQPSEVVTFYTTPSFVPVNGAEWGGYDQPIITSELFGEGKKNTDIIAAVTQTNNPPSHPTVPSHDIAADLTLAFSQNNLDDWFLPSYEELEEAFNVLGSNGLNMLPNPPGINNEKTVYWTSTGLNPVNNQLANNVNSNELAWCYITPFNTTFLYRKCKTLSVLPVRRFECPEDEQKEGIQYDYRLCKGFYDFNYSLPDQVVTSYDAPGNEGEILDDSVNTTADASPGKISFMGDNQPVDIQTFFESGLIYPGDILQDGYSGMPNFPVGTVRIRFPVNSDTPSVGELLFPPYAFLGPVMHVYSQYFASTGNIHTVVVFGAYGGGNPVSFTFSPLVPFIVLKWSVLGPNPNYYPSTFGNSRNELGRESLTIFLSQHDVRLNNLRDLYALTLGFDNDELVKIRFNIKVYNQFEVLMGDYDYKLGFAGWKYGAWNCGATRCTWCLDGELVSANYVNPDYAHPTETTVIDLTDHFNVKNTNGSGYVSIEIAETEYVYSADKGYTPNLTVFGSVVNLQWSNFNPPSYFNGRGNTLNLQNWLGLGNHRADDPNNLPAAWSNTYERFGWGVVCMPCGHMFSTTGTVLGTNCMNTFKREWIAELPIDHPNFYINSPDTFIQAIAGVGLVYSDPVNCQNYTNGAPVNMSYPSFGGSAGWGGVNVIGSGWYSTSTSHPCSPPATSVVNDENNISFKKLLVTEKNDKYPKDLNQCFDDTNVVEEIEVIFDDPNNKNLDENLSTRARFFNNNKNIIETGPFAIVGYYPLYDTVQGAIFASPISLEARDGENTHGYHIHEFNGVEYYMPNGLQMGVTQFHGDYNGQIIEEPKIKIIQEVAEQEEVQEQETPIVLPEEDEEIPPPTYTPPPSSSGSSEGGGY